MPDSNLPTVALPVVVVPDAGPLEPQRGNICHTRAWKAPAAYSPVPLDFEEMAVDQGEAADQAQETEEDRPQTGDSQEVIELKEKIRAEKAELRAKNETKAILRANKKAAREMHARQHHYYEARRLPDGTWQVRSVSAVHSYDLKTLNQPVFKQDIIYNYQPEGAPTTFAEAMKRLYAYEAHALEGVESFDPRDEKRSPSVHYKEFLEREGMIQDRTGTPFRKLDVLIDPGIGLFTEEQLNELKESGILRPLEHSPESVAAGSAKAGTALAVVPAPSQALVVAGEETAFNRYKIGTWLWDKMYRKHVAKKFMSKRPEHTRESDDLEAAIKSALAPSLIVGILENYPNAKLSYHHWRGAATNGPAMLDLLLTFAEKNPDSVEGAPDYNLGRSFIMRGYDDALAMVMKSHGKNILESEAERSAGDPPLLAVAIDAKNQKASKILLENGAPFDWVHPATGQSLFMLAAELGDDYVVNFVAQAGYNVNEQRASDKKTALMLALIEDRKQTVNILLSADSRIDLQDKDGKLATHYGALSHNIQFLKAAARRSPGIMEKFDWQLRTPLLTVAELGTPEARKTAFAMITDPDIACDVSRIDAEGRSLLAFAALHGWDDVIEAALKRRADPNAGAIDGKSPLMLAIEAQNPTTAMKLIEGERLENGTDGKGADLSLPVDGEGNTVLHALAAKGMDMLLPVIMRRLGDSPIVNQTNHKGLTPLLTAADAGHWDFVNKIFDKGAVSDEAEATLAHYAMRAKRKDVLAKYFARMPAFDHTAKGTLDGKTLVQLAIDSDEPELLRMVPNFKTGIDAPAPDGETAITYALKNGKTKMAAFLIKDAGASFIKTNRFFETPFELMIQAAAKTGDLKLLQLLPDTSALGDKTDADGKDTGVALVDRIAMNGETPLTTAIKAKRKDLANWLIHAGASKTAANRALETPFALVMSTGMEDLLGHFLGNDFDTSTALVQGESVIFHLDDLSEGKFRDFVRDFRTPDVRNKAGQTLIELMIAQASTTDRSAQRLVIALEEIALIRQRAQDGDLEAAKRADAWTAVMNTQRADGQPPLHQALLKFRPEYLTKDVGMTGALKGKTVLELMLIAGADPNGANRSGETPLILTINKGWQADFKTLLGLPGVDPNRANRFGETPLMIAARKIGAEDSDSVFAAELLRRTTDFTAKNFYGHTAAHIVSSNDGASWELMTHFIPESFPIDLADNAGNTILLLNLKAARPMSGLKVLGRGADPTLPNKHGENPFLMTLASDKPRMRESRAEILDALFEDAEKIKRQGNAEQIKRLDAIIGDTKVDGFVSRMFSYAEEKPEHAAKLFKSMLSFGLDPNARLANGQSLLAAALNHPQAAFRSAAVASLLASGVDVDQPINISAKKGERPAGLALGIDPTLVPDILAKSKDRDWQDSEGRTILVRSIIASRDPDLHQKILTLGVNPDIQDKNGDTALHHAVDRQLVRTMAQLFDAKADVSLRNKKGYNPVESLWWYASQGADVRYLWESLSKYLRHRPLPKLFDATSLDDKSRRMHVVPLLHALLTSDDIRNVTLGSYGIIHGADVLIKDGNGETLLTNLIGNLTAQNGGNPPAGAPDRAAIIRAVLENWITDPQVRQQLATMPGKDGKTPAQLAASFPEIAKIIKRSASPAPDAVDHSPKHSTPTFG